VVPHDLTIPPRRNLVIVAAGNHSLHEEYAVGYREFDLWILHYADDEAARERYAQTAELVIPAKGLKIELMRKILVEGALMSRTPDLSPYKYIFIPDDDIRFPKGADSINYLFRTVEVIRADMFQTAVANEHFSIGWDCTRWIPEAFCHRVNMTETMMHGFSYEALTKGYLPAIHVMDFMRSGWGIDVISMKMAEAALGRKLRTFVLDCIPAIHTRPSGGGDSVVHRIGRAEAKLVPQMLTNPPHTIKTYWSRETAVMETDDYHYEVTYQYMAER
jgi:hypothetical protein